MQFVINYLSFSPSELNVSFNHILMNQSESLAIHFSLTMDI